MSEINLNNINNRYRLTKSNPAFKNIPQEYPQQSIPQGLIPDVQTTMPQPKMQIQQTQVTDVEIPYIYQVHPS